MAAPSSDFIITPLSQVHLEGSYVSSATGRLYQIPWTALEGGRAPELDGAAPNGDEVVVRLSSNPFASFEKLRYLCAQVNVEPRF